MKKIKWILFFVTIQAMAQEKQKIFSEEDKEKVFKVLKEIEKTLPTKETIEIPLKEIENFINGKAGPEMHILSFRLMGIAAFASNFCGNEKWKKDFENALNRQDKSFRPKLKKAFDEGWEEAKKQSIEKLLPCDHAKNKEKT